MESPPSPRIRCSLVSGAPEEALLRTTVMYSHSVMEMLAECKLGPKMELVMCHDHVYQREGDEWRLLDGHA